MPPAVSIPRTAWLDVTEAFRTFFDGLGEVTLSDDTVAFDGGDTGLSLDRDGTSRSFMPLHQLGARWEQVRFDQARWQVVLTSEEMEYSYTVPPRLRP